MEITSKFVPGWETIEHEGEKIEFLCAPLSSPQRLDIAPMIRAKGTHGQGLMATALASVRDWRGITRDGQPVPFSSAALTEFFAAPKREPILLQLAARITARSNLTEDEIKKS